MPLSRLTLSAFFPIAFLSAQPPAIFQDGVSNAASRVPSSLPFGGLAPSSRVYIKGVRFGTHPSLTIKAGDGRYTARLLRTERLAAEFLFPPDVPPGSAELIVEAEGGPSRPFEVNIASNAFGIQSLHRTGRIITLEGTGLGKDVATEVVVAGQSILASTVRKGEDGNDRIQFELPKPHPPGCHIPLYVRTPSHVSNFVDLADLPGCKDSSWPALSPMTKGAGSVILLRTTLSAQGATWTADSVDAVFLRSAKQVSQTPMWFPLAVGQCRMRVAIEETQQDPLKLLRFDTTGMKTASAGPGIVFGSRRVTMGDNGVYTATLGGHFPTMRSTKPLFFDPRKTYVISASEGKTGKFKLSLPFVDDLEFRLSSSESIDRTAPLSIRWKTSQPQVAIVLFSQNTKASVQAICAASGDVGTFTIPPDILRSLPMTERVAGQLSGYAGVIAMPQPATFKPSGLADAVATSLRFRLEEVDFR